MLLKTLFLHDFNDSNVHDLKIKVSVHAIMFYCFQPANKSGGRFGENYYKVVRIVETLANDEHSAKHICGDTNAQVIATTSQRSVVDPQPAQALQQILKDAQTGKFSHEVEKVCTAYVKKEVEGVRRWKNCALQDC